MSNQSPLSSTDSGLVFARRAISLSKSYVILGVALSVVGVIISNLFHALSNLNLLGAPTTFPGASSGG